MNKYIVVGAGLTGCTIARVLKDSGKDVIVFERNKIGGNCRTEMRNGMEIHIHGAHTWHNSDETVRNFMNRFTEFRQYIHNKFICYKGKFYRIPINIELLKQYNHTLPSLVVPENFEDYLIRKAGKELYEIFYKQYSLKQWGTLDIPIEIAKRIPIHYDLSLNYFYEDFHALPENYNTMFENMLDGIKVIDAYFTNSHFEHHPNQTIIYTGSLDECFKYDMGMLSYRTIDHVEKEFNMNYYQPCATLNYTDERPCLRSIEHKHLNNHSLNDKTIVTFEYVQQAEPKDTLYYPMWDYGLYEKYRSRLPDNVIPAGRLGTYRYLDMNVAVREALKLAEELL